MFIVKTYYTKSILFSIIFLATFCTSVQKKESITGTGSLPLNSKSAEMVDKFFSLDSVEEEAFRVFISSESYLMKQTGYEDTINITEDVSGRNPVAEELKAYDLVDIFTEAIYKVELFKDSGLISHIRPVKPSHISEINKIIADDITRLKFKFLKEEENNEISSFKIRYGVQLHKKKSNEEIKKILQENVRQ